MLVNPCCFQKSNYLIFVNVLSPSYDDQSIYQQIEQIGIIFKNTSVCIILPLLQLKR